MDEWIELRQLKVKELYNNFPQKGRPGNLFKEERLDQYSDILR